MTNRYLATLPISFYRLESRILICWHINDEESLFNYEWD